MDLITFGIDTSCYYTSVCLMKNKEVVLDLRKKLVVKEGECGLRQSDALFMHISKLPDLLKEAFSTYRSDITGICVTSRPRNAEGSYMPVFRAASSFGKSIAHALLVDYKEISHQDSHLAAGIYSCKREDLLNDEFIGLHISGGTTELVHVKQFDMDSGTFSHDIIGGTRDLNAGQFVDRIGVSMGFPFPAGISLEKCAKNVELKCEEDVILPVSVDGTYLSFSGPESAARRLMGSVENAKLARAVELCIARSLSEICFNACVKYETKKLLIVGGVASNEIVKREITTFLKRKIEDVEILIADLASASDNAIGSAYVMQILKGNC